MTTAKVNNYPTTPLGLKEPKTSKAGVKGEKKKNPQQKPKPFIQYNNVKKKINFPAEELPKHWLQEKHQ